VIKNFENEKGMLNLPAMMEDRRRRQSTLTIDPFIAIKRKRKTKTIAIVDCRRFQQCWKCRPSFSLIAIERERIDQDHSYRQSSTFPAMLEVSTKSFSDSHRK
jgi:hypothetical protein